MSESALQHQELLAATMKMALKVAALGIAQYQDRPGPSMNPSISTRNYLITKSYLNPFLLNTGKRSASRPMTLRVI